MVCFKGSRNAAEALHPQMQAACSLPEPEGPVERFFFRITVSPGCPKGGKGGCTMTFEQVVLLLTLLGGAIYVTFQITWTVSQSHRDDKKKK